MLTVGPLEKARLYIESHQRTIDESKESGQNIIPGPCITISRQTGAGAHAVSNRLIELLKSVNKKENALWSLFDKNLIEKVLEGETTLKSSFPNTNLMRTFFFYQIVNR